MKKVYVAILILLVLLTVLFYPKYCGYSESTFLRKPGTTIKTEKCTCLGFNYKTEFDRWNLIGVSDAGEKYWCSGIPVGKKIYETTTIS